MVWYEIVEILYFIFIIFKKYNTFINNDVTVIAKV